MTKNEAIQLGITMMEFRILEHKERIENFCLRPASINDIIEKYRSAIAILEGLKDKEEE